MQSDKTKSRPKILIVDDLEVNVSILENIILTEGYEPLCALNVQEALDIMKEDMPQLILSDITMPGMNGLEFCKLLKSNPKTRAIPVIFITVADSREEKRAAFQAGAVDFIPKPFEPVEVVMRINNQLESFRIKQEMEDYNRMMHKMVGEQKKQMEKERESVLLALTKIMERKKPYIGQHLERVGYNCRILAQSLQLVSEYEDQISDEFVDTICTAAKLHDIGNILMSDEARAEDAPDGGVGFYAEEGAAILESISMDNSSRFLDMAISIARFHHANWDGTGYPGDVKGAEIPLEARIAAVVNDFDTLLWRQKEKSDNPVEECLEMIREKSGAVYEPGIVEVFGKVRKQMKTD